MLRSRGGLRTALSGQPSQRPVVDIPARVLGIAAIVLLAWVLAAGLSLTPVEAVAVLPAGYTMANVVAFSGVVFDRRRGGLSLMVAFFFLFFVALPAGVQVSEGVFPFLSSYNPVQLTQAYVLLAGAQVAYMSGVALVDARRARVKPEDVCQADVCRISYRFSWSLLALCWAIIAYLGPRNLFSTRAELATDALASEGMQQQLLFVGRSLALLALLIPAVELRGASGVGGWRRNGHAVATIIVAGLTTFTLNFPPALPRFQLLGVALSLFAVLLNLFASKVKFWFSAGATIFLFFLFPAIKAIGEGGVVDFAAAFTSDVKQYLLRVDFDAFKQVADTIIYLDKGPLRAGENFLGVGLFWVPRSIWAAKPIHTGELVSSSLGYPYTNVSSPLPAEGYVSFGVIGLILVMVLAGWVVARVERRVAESVGGVLGTTFVLYALLIGYSTIILRGALNSVAPMFMTAFVVYAIYAATRRQRASSGINRLEASEN